MRASNGTTLQMSAIATDVIKERFKIALQALIGAAVPKQGSHMNGNEMQSKVLGWGE